MLTFLRGDVAPAKRIVPYVVTDETAYPPIQLGWGSGGFPEALNRMGLRTGVGSVFLEKGQTLTGHAEVFAPPAVDASRLSGARVVPLDADAGEGAQASDTGELRLDAAAGSFTFATDRGASIVLTGSAKHATAGPLSARTDGVATVYAGSLDGTPAFLGCSDVDAHIPLARVHESADVLRRLGAAVDVRIYPGMGHTVNADELDAVRIILSNATAGTAANRVP